MSILEQLTEIQAKMDSMPEERAELILQARSEGHTWRSIAKALDITEHGAVKASKLATERES